MSEEERKDVLESLLNLDGSLGLISERLAGITWDSDEELVVLQRDHVVSLLQRYLSNEISADDVEAWGNLIEGREDVGYEPNHRDLIEEALHELANPEITSRLTRSLANEWVARLQSADDDEESGS